MHILYVYSINSKYYVMKACARSLTLHSYECFCSHFSNYAIISAKNWIYIFTTWPNNDLQFVQGNFSFIKNWYFRRFTNVTSFWKWHPRLMYTFRKTCSSSREFSCSMVSIWSSKGQNSVRDTIKIISNGSFLLYNHP